jgi:hypothetical protein
LNEVANNYIVWTTTFSPFSWPGTIGVQFDGEVYYTTSRVPGSASAPQAYSSMAVQNFNNNLMYSTCGYANLVTINYNSSIFGQSTPSCSQSNIWDKSN